MQAESRTVDAEEITKLREAVVDLGFVVAQVILALYQVNTMNMQLKAAIVTRGVDDATFQKALDAHNTTSAEMKAELEKAFEGVATIFRNLGAEDA
jgi:HD-like signal output (HDOD) protein